MESTSGKDVNQAKNAEECEPTSFLISGAGIVGLVLALSLKKHLGITAEIYEKARGYAEDVGAGLGFYPNGMRVLRDIDPMLLQALKEEGCPYRSRRWESHDGTLIAGADDEVLSPEDEELCSLGIKRWRLQQVLHQAAKDAGIPIYFNKATVDISENNDTDLIQVHFSDGTSRFTRVLFGADGAKSKVREIVTEAEAKLEYCGITCLMGTAKYPDLTPGIRFPSSASSRFHAVYFPVNKNELCFQIHFHVTEEESNPNDWGNLSPNDGKVRFEAIAKKMETEGWDSSYTEPLKNVGHSVRVGFALLQERLRRWVYGRNGRIVLVGDAAHPPVPYVGQGAQMGVEDAGTLALILKQLRCVNPADDGSNPTLNFAHWEDATRLYEEIRIPRTSTILDCSRSMGSLQERRCQESTMKFADLALQGDVLLHKTVPELLTGATYSYSEEVRNFLLLRKKRSRRKLSKRSSTGVDKKQMEEAMAALWGSVPFVS